MFEKLRRPAKIQRKYEIKKVFSYIVFGAICLVFVFLMPGGSQLLGSGSIAHIGSEPIRSRELRQVEEGLRNQYRRRLNEVTGEELDKLQSQIRQSALQQLIDMHLISQGAKKEGFIISDKELQNEIKSYPVFQNNGHFTYSSYLAFLKNQGLTASSFEDRVRRYKFTSNWRGLFTKSIFSNALEKSKLNEKDQYKIKLRFAEVSLVDESKSRELENFVVNGDARSVNIFLQKNKVNWQNNNKSSLFGTFKQPALGNEEMLDAIVDQLPQRGLVKRLVKRADKAYIVEILSFKKEKEPSQSKVSFSSFLEFEKPSRFFENWMKLQKEQIPVKINREI